MKNIKDYRYFLYSADSKFNNHYLNHLDLQIINNTGVYFEFYDFKN